jgi:N-methylhydantoinase A
MAKDFIPYTVYDRYQLFPKATFRGPAIIEEKESTVMVGEDASVSVDDFGFLWIDIKEGKVEEAPRKTGFKAGGKRSRRK